MPERTIQELSRRERQAMDVVYRLGRATAAEIRRQMPEPPTYSAVRAILRILEQKGHLRHETQGQRFIFIPTVTPGKARRSVLQHIARTFFEDSAEQLVATLLDVNRDRLTKEDFDRLASLIEDARQEEK